MLFYFLFLFSFFVKVDGSSQSKEGESSKEDVARRGADGDDSSAAEGAVGGAEEGPKFKNILETIRAFQKREFRPNARVSSFLCFPVAFKAMMFEGMCLN